MIVLDTSALIAIRDQENEAPAMEAVLVTMEPRFLPAAAYLEFVLATHRSRASRLWLDKLLANLHVRVHVIDHLIAEIAANAAERYGRGSGHPARLNFGDCLSYAVAKHLSAPLLYKGDDFVHTDIQSALAP